MPEFAQSRDFRGVIEWDAFDAEGPLDAARAIWQNVCSSVGPIVTIQDGPSHHVVDLWDETVTTVTTDPPHAPLRAAE